MFKGKTEKIAAIVVTYNRKILLSKCLSTLLNQTLPLDAIYIIDNASTDGTAELLVEEKYIKKPLYPDKGPLEEVKEMTLPKLPDMPTEIHYVRMHENTGGAGGFHEGVKRGYQAGFNWLWLMDDDGFPEEKTLEVFCSLKADQASCYCPLVVDPLNKNLLTFGFCGFRDKKEFSFQSMDDVNIFINSFKTKIISGYGNFFNGIYLSSKIINNVGFPRKEMYIWGDENEYLFRILSNGFNILIMLDNVFYHPRFPQSTITFLGKKIFYNDNPATWKFYYQTRNLLYINKKYRSQLKVRWPLLKCLLSRLILAAHVKKIRNFILLGLFDQTLGLPYRTLGQLKK